MDFRSSVGLHSVDANIQRGGDTALPNYVMHRTMRGELESYLVGVPGNPVQSRTACVSRHIDHELIIKQALESTQGFD